MISLEEAQARILRSLPSPGAEMAPLRSAHGRFLASDIAASGPLPRFDNSAMDGYAVRAQDLSGASPENPAVLRLAGRIPAGQEAALKVEPGTCIRIFTGSPLPAGADAVVMQEDTEPASSGEQVRFLETVKPWENIRFAGEDVSPGAGIGRRGERLRAGHAALLGALGFQQVSVGVRPRITLLASGNELREAGAELRGAEIFESNRTALQWLCEAAGACVTLGPILPDDSQSVQEGLRTAFEGADAVICSGGVSVGEFDFIKEAFGAIGGEIDFWRVDMKPGKPFVWGRRSGQLFFGLPGNPVSAFVTFLLLVRPALLAMQGAVETQLGTHPARLDEPVANPGDRRLFMRVRVEASGLVRSAGLQASHRLFSLARANALLDLPPGTRWEKGTEVKVLRWI